MDIQTQDGILLRGIPEGTPDEAIKARIQKIRAERIPEPKRASMVDVAKNAIAEGVAGVPDMLLNLPNRVRNLSQIPVGIGRTLAGHPELAPEMQPDPDLARKAGVAVGAIDPEVVPRGAEQKVVDALLRGGVGGALTGGSGAMTGLLKNAALGGASSLAATGAQEATGSPIAGVIAGAAVPGAIAGYSAAATNVAPKLMQSAIKPSTKDIRTGDAEKAVRTMLDEGINATKGGAGVLKDRVKEANQEIAEAIANSKATVKKDAVASRLDELDQRSLKQVNPASDVSLLKSARDEFNAHPLLADDIPVQLAQEMKQGTYKQLSKKYGGVSGVADEAQKALARGFKEEIAAVVPEVGTLNARESDLLRALKMVEKRAATDANRNPVGIGSISPSASNLVASLADRSALVKSLLARAMNSSGAATSGVGANSVIPLSFQEDALQRQKIIEALMGAR